MMPLPDCRERRNSVNTLAISLAVKPVNDVMDSKL
jgi:hypothetical protein